GFLDHISSDSQSDTAAVWQVAKELSAQLQLKSVSAATLAAALVKSVPGIDGILAQLQLDSNDMTNGAEWHAHLTQLIERHKKRANNGGLARDWSFGYTPLLTRFGINISDQVARGNLLSTELETHRDALAQLS